MAVGTNAIPFLINILRIRDTRLRQLGFRLSQNLPASLQKYWPQFPYKPSLRHRAAVILKAFGPEARPALPELIQGLRIDKSPEYLDTIGSIGPGAKEAQPILRSSLTNENEVFQIHAAYALWKVGRETNAVLNVYKEALIKRNSHASATDAAQAGASMDEASRAVLGAILVNTLRDSKRAGMRSQAALELGFLRDRSDATKRALLLGAKDADAEVRDGCAMSLWWLWPEDAECIAIGVHGFFEWRNDSKLMRITFLRGALGMGTDPATTSPALKECLHDADPKIRSQASEALKAVEAFESSPAGKQFRPGPQLQNQDLMW